MADGPGEPRASGVSERLEVVLRARDGCGEAFGRLYDELAPLARGAAYRRTRDVHEAEDAAQDAFLDAYRSISQLSDPGSFEAWLLRIVRNRAIDHARDLARCRPSLRACDDELDRARGMPRVVLRKGVAEPPPDQVALVRGTFGEMSRPLRRAVRLRYVVGLSCDEIARREGVSLGAVKTRLHRARMKLRAALDPG